MDKVKMSAWAKKNKLDPELPKTWEAYLMATGYTPPRKQEIDSAKGYDMSPKPKERMPDKVYDKEPTKLDKVLIKVKERTVVPEKKPTMWAKPRDYNKGEVHVTKKEPDWRPVFDPETYKGMKK